MSTADDIDEPKHSHAISTEDLAWLADSYEGDLVGDLAQAFLDSREETSS